MRPGETDVCCFWVFSVVYFDEALIIVDGGNALNFDCTLCIKIYVPENEVKSCVQFICVVF